MGLLAGLLLLLLVILGGRWFASTPPRTVLRSGGWALAVLLVAGVIALAATGRLGWALAALAGLLSWLVRLGSLHGLLRRVWRLSPRSVRSAPPPRSRVETRFLRMSLDHDTGAIDGEVIAGPFAGRLLSGLDYDEALDLRRASAADPQSLQLLEAWLDRTWPDWRSAGSGAGHDNRTAAPGPMTREEALEILGLEPGADREAVRRAHRSLMTKVHPDHGGSNYLAAKINQAKDVLLKIGE